MVEKKYVTKDMVIGDVLNKYPDAAMIMLEHGLHCVGCHANVYDTIEAGCAVHGLGPDVVDKMVKDINEMIELNMSKDGKKAQDSKKSGLTLTESAAKKLSSLLESEPEGSGLKVMVMPGGCSGYVYQMSFEKEAEENDVTFEDKGIKIFVDKDSLDLLNGAEIDYVDSLNESGFKVNNPNASHGCGCGKSFG